MTADRFLGLGVSGIAATGALVWVAGSPHAEFLRVVLGWEQSAVWVWGTGLAWIFLCSAIAWRLAESAAKPGWRSLLVAIIGATALGFWAWVAVFPVNVLLRTSDVAVAFFSPFLSLMYAIVLWPAILGPVLAWVAVIRVAAVLRASRQRALPQRVTFPDAD